MKKIISILLVTLLLGCSNVYAKDYSVKVGTRNDNVENYCSYPIVSANCSEKENPYHVGVGQVFHISGNNESINGYCIDPHIATPEDGTYVEIEDLSEIKEHIESLKYICSKTEGNSDLRIAAIKAYSANTGLHGSANNNVIKAYKGLLDGTTVWNTSFGQGLSAGKDVLNGALDLTGKETTADEIKFINENGKLKLITTVPGKIVLKETKYEFYINGIKQTKNEVEVKAGTYQVELKGNCKEEDKLSSDVSFVYEKEDLKGVSSSEYTIRYFKKKSNATSNQRLIACDKNESDHDCENGICTKSEKLEVVCNTEVCEEPKVEQGQNLCGDNGDTIISVTESPNKLEYIGNNCFSSLPLATEKILDHTNEYCEIRCSESYKLELPGPDAKVSNGDSEVKINAGSYFTIDTKDKMYSESTFTCYGKMNYSKYQNDISTLKGNIAKAYNNLSETATMLAIVRNLKPDDKGICTIPNKTYEIYEVENSGKLVSKPSGGKIESKEYTCDAEEIEKTKKALEEQTKKDTDALLKAVEESNKKIEERNELWKECLTWDISELNKLFEKENCSTNIEFDYSSESICDMKVVVDEAGKIKGQDVKEYKSTANKEKIYNSTCNINEDLDKCNTAGTTETYNYINQQATVKTTYKFDNDFTVEYATGKVSCEAKTGDGYSKVINGFPVSINTPQGIHEYKYTYTNIGHNFDEENSCAGRFDNLINDKNNHNCKYDVNNCDDCKVYCDPEGVCNQDVCDGECQVACVGAGCIRDVNAGFLATYKTVSLNETFNVAMLSNHDGVNFIALADNNKNYSSNESFSGTNWNNEKGIATKANINKLGETIYNAEPEYSITLTPAVISNIKKYNAEQEDSDASDAKGYLNNTLKCTNVNGTNYGQCLSTFIHNSDNKWNFNILDKKTSSDQVIVEIDGNKAVFKSYLEIPKAFEGPAWK